MGERHHLKLGGQTGMNWKGAQGSPKPRLVSKLHTRRRQSPGACGLHLVPPPWPKPQGLTYLGRHGPPLDATRAGDKDLVGHGGVLGEQRVAVLRRRVAPVDVERRLLALGGGLQGEHGVELAAETGREVFQGGQVLVHDVLLRQLPRADRVALETLHEFLEDGFHAEFGQVVVLLDLAVEGARDAVLEAAQREEKNGSGK